MSAERLIPDYADVFTLRDFVLACQCGSFVDYDGSGEYAIDGRLSRIAAIPSMILAGSIEERFTHVTWFNK
jgi:hypothetical protein